MTGDGTEELISRYVAAWNEADPQQRRREVRQLWAEGAVHLVEAPEEIRKAGYMLGFPRTELEVRGHGELEFRVSQAHREFVAEGGHTFRLGGDAGRLRDVVKFRWEMVSAGGEVAAAGLEFLKLGEDGRIVADYQFIEA